MMKLNTKRKQTGIGLLELMLAMVIIAIMTLMSIQYFSASKRNTLTSKGVDEIQDIISIVSGMPSPTSVTDLNQAIVLSGQLPQEYAYQVDSTYYIGTPWTTQTSDKTTGTVGVSATLSASVSGNTLTITSKDLPNWACQSLADKMLAETSDGGASVGQADGGKTETSGCTFGKDGTPNLTLNFYIKPNQNL